jgi:hypothetical protein
MQGSIAYPQEHPRPQDPAMVRIGQLPIERLAEGI